MNAPQHWQSIAESWLATVHPDRPIFRTPNIVRLIYVDGAGIAQNEPVAVFAGVIIKDRQWLDIEREARAIESRLPKEMQTVDFEFHGHELAYGSKKFRRNKVSKEIRFRALREFLSLVGKYRLRVFYALRNTDSSDTQVEHETMIGLSFFVCVWQIENWFARHAKKDAGIIVADREKDFHVEEIYKRDFLRQRRGLAMAGPPLNHIVDTLHFADSRESVGLQLADCCAYFIKRYNMNPDDEWSQFYRLIEPHITDSAHFGRMRAIKLKRTR